MGARLSVEQFADADWFPSGIAQAIDPAAEQAPLGFEAWRLHTIHDSHLMVWPEGDVESADWWRKILPIGGGGKRWGTAPDFSDVTVEKVDGWGGPTFDIHEASGRQLVAKILPLDECGHGRTLSELDCEILDSATGGIQWKGRDVVLFFRKEIGKNAVELVDGALADNDFKTASEICRNAGRVLGVFHLSALNRRSLPNDERRWNNRLKELEARLQSNTLWRAPHTKQTKATITHRNFGLETVRIDEDDEYHISGCFDGVPNAILPSTMDFPVFRDIAAGYRSISRIAAKHNLQYEPASAKNWGWSELDSHDWPDPEPSERWLRRELLAGWNSVGWSTAGGRRAMNGYKGGVAIWEYEQVLEESATAQAYGQEVPDRVRWWLDHVSRIQSSLGVAQVISGGSKLCFLAAILSLLGDQSYPTPTTRLAIVLGLVLAGLGLQFLHFVRAPPPY